MSEPTAPAPRQDDRLLRLPEVEHRSGLNKSTIYRRIEDGQFPQPVRASDRVVGWIESEFMAWLQALPRVSPKELNGP